MLTGMSRDAENFACCQLLYLCLYEAVNTVDELCLARICAIRTTHGALRVHNAHLRTPRMRRPKAYIVLKFKYSFPRSLGSVSMAGQIHHGRLRLTFPPPLLSVLSLRLKPTRPLRTHQRSHILCIGAAPAASSAPLCNCSEAGNGEARAVKASHLPFSLSFPGNRKPPTLFAGTWKAS